jgi:hypothetical protein
MKLTSNHLVQVSGCDNDLLESRRWFIDNKGFVRRSIKQKGKVSAELIHRVIGARIAGRSLRADELMDHIDHNRLNNQRSNLRIVNASESSQNRCTNRPFRGAHWHKRFKTWTATVRCRGVDYWCGSFKTKEEAALAAVTKRKELGFLTNHL